MGNTLINKVLIHEKIKQALNAYRKNSIDFSQLIQTFESMIKEFTSTSDIFFVTLDKAHQELTLLSQNRDLAIENIEETFSVILECYYSKKYHLVEDVGTSFLYNQELDQLVEYTPREILVYPLLDREGNIAAILWLAHTQESEEKFNPIDFENLDKITPLLVDTVLQKDDYISKPTPSTPTDSTEMQEEIVDDRLNILIVDDDIIILKFLSAVLEQQDFRVEIAHSGIEALKIYKSIDNIDLIFMDEVMNGGMYGHQVVEKIRSIETHSKQRPLPIIALTSDTTKETRTLLLEAGCNLVLYKPIDPEKIIAAILSLSQD